MDVEATQKLRLAIRELQTAVNMNQRDMIEGATHKLHTLVLELENPQPVAEEPEPEEAEASPRGRRR